MARSFLGGEFAGGESAWWRGDWIPPWISRAVIYQTEGCRGKMVMLIYDSLK